jgi:hypothetical protein
MEEAKGRVESPASKAVEITGDAGRTNKIA